MGINVNDRRRTALSCLSLKLAAEAMDRDIVVFFNEIGVEAISLINREDESDSVEILWTSQEEKS